MMPQDKDKNRFRKLRNPTQTSPLFRSSCATCIRSKSMEDVRTEIVTDWPTYNKENYNEFKKNRLNNNGALGLMKHGVRRSMDNLLEVETSNFGKRFQVGQWILFFCCFNYEFWFSLSLHLSFSTINLSLLLCLSPAIHMRWPCWIFEQLFLSNELSSFLPLFISHRVVCSTSD